MHDVCMLEGWVNEGRERETVRACTVSRVRPTHGHPRNPYTTCAGSKGGRMRAGQVKRCGTGAMSRCTQRVSHIQHCPMLSCSKKPTGGLTKGTTMLRGLRTLKKY